MKYHSDVLILGAGAAGLMCAIEAGKRGRSVTVLESSNRAGQKILISGGGRCNFTNVASGADDYISANPHFAKSALARYTPRKFYRHGRAPSHSPGMRRNWASCSATAAPRTF